MWCQACLLENEGVICCLRLLGCIGWMQPIVIAKVQVDSFFLVAVVYEARDLDPDNGAVCHCHFANANATGLSLCIPLSLICNGHPERSHNCSIILSRIRSPYHLSVQFTFQYRNRSRGFTLVSWLKKLLPPSHSVQPFQTFNLLTLIPKSYNNEFFSYTICLCLIHFIATYAAIHRSRSVATRQ